MKRRIDILSFLFAAIFGLVLWRLFSIQVVERNFWAHRQDFQVNRDMGFLAPRGAILDRKGKPLVLSVEVVSVAADPRRIRDPHEVARRLAPMIERSVREVQEALEEEGRAFVWLARRLPKATADRIRELSIPGISFRTEYVRDYPNGSVAAHLLGFVGWEGKGLEGIEKSLDRDLRGSDDAGGIARDASGLPIPTPDAEGWKNDGLPVELSIDLLIQSAAEEALDEALDRFHAKSASAVVVDPATGEILALASRPSYDPNRFSEADPARFRNPAVEYAFEPGSTFKPFVLAGALENRTVPVDASYDCPGEVTIHGTRIQCHDPHGRVDLERMIAVSCNVAAIRVATSLPAPLLEATLRGYGFGEPTGVRIPAEAGGIFRRSERWSGLSEAMLGIGQEISVTPIQLAQGAAILAEDGVRRPLRIVRKVGGAPFVSNSTPRRIFSSEAVRKVRAGLERVITEGTGRLAAVPGVVVAGKTGTAQVSEPGRGYVEGKYNAVFWGFAPSQSPRLVIAVVVHEPDASIGYYGGQVAAPAFARIAREGLRVLGALPRAASTAPTSSGPFREGALRTPPEIATGAQGIRVPDLRGLTLRQIHDLFSEYPVHLRVRGDGLVVAQSPAVGTWMREGGEVSVRLELTEAGFAAANGVASETAAVPATSVADFAENQAP